MATKRSAPKTLMTAPKRLRLDEEAIHKLHTKNYGGGSGKPNKLPEIQSTL